MNHSAGSLKDVGTCVENQHTDGYEDSQLCNFATSHSSSLPFSFAISLIFLLSDKFNILATFFSEKLRTHNTVMYKSTHCSGSPPKGVLPIIKYKSVTPADQTSTLQPWWKDLRRTYTKNITSVYATSRMKYSSHSRNHNQTSGARNPLVPTHGPSLRCFPCPALPISQII